MRFEGLEESTTAVTFIYDFFFFFEKLNGLKSGGLFQIVLRIGMNKFKN